MENFHFAIYFLLINTRVQKVNAVSFLFSSFRQPLLIKAETLLYLFPHLIPHGRKKVGGQEQKVQWKPHLHPKLPHCIPATGKLHKTEGLQRTKHVEIFHLKLKVEYISILQGTTKKKKSEHILISLFTRNTPPLPRISSQTRWRALARVGQADWHKYCRHPTLDPRKLMKMVSQELSENYRTIPNKIKNKEKCTRFL